MELLELSVSGYRSLANVRRLRLQPLNVIVGPNGVGKSNLYRSLYLLHRAAEGRLARTLLEEGGMPSVVWRGRRRKGRPVRVRIAIELDDLVYELSFGLPVPSASAFNLDPCMKEEHAWLITGGRRVRVMERSPGSATVRDADGNRRTFPFALDPAESILSELRDPAQFPELARLRQELLGWRFYHQFRTDPASPLRRAQPSVRTVALAHDGTDLAAALQTIREIGMGDDLQRAVADAFPGASVEVEGDATGMAVGLRMPDFHSPFAQHELSDGTLQYLCLLAALLTPRPAALMAFNEPEASIHPDLFPALARLITAASRRSQVWVTTHADRLADLLSVDGQGNVIRLQKVAGETHIVGHSALGPSPDDDGPLDDPAV